MRGEELGWTSDAWEWDEDYLLEELSSCPQSGERTDQSAWLPDYSQELDLELDPELVPELDPELDPGLDPGCRWASLGAT